MGMNLRGGQMIEVQIGSNKRDIEDASQSWINEQLGRRRRDEGVSAYKSATNLRCA